MIQAVLFDFNGVVIDDEPLHLKAFQEVLSSEGVGLTEEDYYSMLGTDEETFVRAAFERAGAEVTDELLRSVVEREAAAHRELLTGELPLFPGVDTFIKALSHKYPLGVVSMSRRAEINYALERAGLARHFSVIVSSEDVRECKPDPECYRRGLERLNETRGQSHVLPYRPDECLVIEDAPPGVRAARAAGMRSLGVTNTVSEQALRAAGADSVTRSLADWTVDAVHHIFDTEWGRR
ncbi:MAG: HAD family phosphatase [Acidobacteria bacterium]|nr:HAD family phosphatase [Acidobacteriota bacterium]